MDRLRAAGKSAQTIANTVTQQSHRVFTYGYFEQTQFAYQSTKNRNETDETLDKYLVATRFGLKPLLKFSNGTSNIVGTASSSSNALAKIHLHLKQKLKDGLLLPTINMSYSGDIEDITQLPSYIFLKTEAARYGVRIAINQMNVVLATFFNIGSLTVAYSAETSEFSH